MNKDAQQVFEALDELCKEGRQGTAAGAKAALKRALAAARAEGVAAAREMAAEIAQEETGGWVASRIRAMRDGVWDCPSREHESHGGMVCGDGLACLCVRSS